MAMKIRSGLARQRAEPATLPSLARIRKFLSPSGGLLGAPVVAAAQDLMAPSTAANWAEPLDLSLPARIRKFLWLSSGLFSAAAFAMPALGIFALGTIETEGIGASFIAGIASACLFALTCILHFGPDTA